MTSDQTNLVLEHLRHIRDKVNNLVDNMQDLASLGGLRRRVDSLDRSVEEIQRRHFDTQFKKLCNMSTDELKDACSKITKDQWADLKGKRS